MAARRRVLIAVLHHHVLGDELGDRITERACLLLFPRLISSELDVAKDFSRLVACLSEADEWITADRVSHLPPVHPSTQGEGLARRRGHPAGTGPGQPCRDNQFAVAGRGKKGSRIVGP